MDKTETDRTIHIQYHKTKLGELIIGSFDNKICLCDWRYRQKRESIDKRIQNYLKANYKQSECQLLNNTKQQIDAFLQGDRNSFDLPLMMAGSNFQKKVWEELVKIPYGKTISYLELSKKTGNEKAIRAVANANGANAISIIIPCHRVIGSNGELTGYAGGIRTKKRLLELENPDFKSKQLSLF